MAIEPAPKIQKSPKISKGAVQVISTSVSPKKNFRTVLKRMIATASLTIPSPNSRLKRVGYSSYLTMEMAAMTSVEQRRDDIRRISGVDRTKSCHSPVVALYIVIQLYEWIHRVKPANRM